MGRTPLKCVLGVGWRPRGPALNRLVSKDELCWYDVHRINVTPSTISLPFGPRPLTNSDITLAFGAVARITFAPPSFHSFTVAD